MLWTPEHGIRPSYGQTELIHAIRRCGLTSGLQLCLDAGDAASYSSGQSWLDTSGNGYDFFRGATSGAEASDPTFNGTAGQRASTNYWSFDGGDFFRLALANPSWVNDLHKDNAKFTLMTWIYFPDITSGTPTIFGTNAATSNPGVIWYFDTAERHLFQVTHGTGAALLIYTSPSIAIGAWHLFAVSIDEAVGANGAFVYVDGVGTNWTSTYTTPSAAAATSTAEIGAAGSAASPLPNTTRLGMFAAWSGVALTQTQLNALYQTTRGRYGV